MDNLSKLLIFLILIIITYSFLNKKENFKAIFTRDLNLEIDNNVEFKGNELILTLENIKAEEICLGKKGSLDPVCIKQKDLQRIISFPDNFKKSICVGNNCSRAEQIYYLKKLWPIGSVIPFQGRESDLPSGWRVCDGSNHLPDLRDSFIKGSGTIDEKYIGFKEDGNNLDGFGVSGGENKVKLEIKETPIHYHFFNINDTLKKGNVSGINSHYLTKDTNSVLYNNGSKLPKPAWGRKTDRDILTPYTTTPTSSFGKGNPHNNLPPYYSLMYIIRVSEDNIEDTAPKTNDTSGSNYFIYNILEKQLLSKNNQSMLTEDNDGEIKLAPPIFKREAQARMYGPWVDNPSTVKGFKHKLKDFYIFFTYDDVYYKMVKRTQAQIENNSNPNNSENKALKISKKSNINSTMISDMWDDRKAFIVPSGNYRLQNMTFL